MLKHLSDQDFLRQHHYSELQGAEAEADAEAGAEDWPERAFQTPPANPNCTPFSNGLENKESSSDIAPLKWQEEKSQPEKEEQSEEE